MCLHGWGGGRTLLEVGCVKPTEGELKDSHEVGKAKGWGGGSELYTNTPGVDEGAPRAPPSAPILVYLFIKLEV